MALLLLAFLLPSLVTARCECGYSVNKTTDAEHTVWTDLMETDFLHIDDVANNSDGANNNIGWVPQVYNVTPALARGTYGKMALLENVVANPLKNPWDWAGEATEAGTDAGLQLMVRSRPVDDMVPIGEIVAARTDMLYGSFRVAMKMTGVPGTCGAFFWFRNDTQEIDVEFLSKQLNASSNLVNLVLQSPQSAAAGYDASHTPNYDVYPLPFRPDRAFHEYRFDWVSDRVSFYADGTWLKDMTIELPNSPGHLVLNHWSNGDALWSAGPPAQDATMTVSYVKAYFNSSDPQRQKDYSLRCAAAAAAGDNATVCQIPNQTSPPDNQGPDANRTARTFFFSDDPQDSVNQTVFDGWRNRNEGGGGPAVGWMKLAAGMAFASVMTVVGIA
ncbi:glycoside hydrolase family 16 protein [Diplodia corticola]|uniref:Glycoside hydrolase family 16 protein n=1 Tax=Diplodia corticola TaxID=236234 RepID=A0A1J9QQC4_9PEZI|nr:glycoside hydrolase family 16 protein [Diplodia corticola]OJD30657.1 glycoside hydrolase family 16 protein [Diplodia corticola]